MPSVVIFSYPLKPNPQPQFFPLCITNVHFLVFLCALGALCGSVFLIAASRAVPSVVKFFFYPLKPNPQPLFSPSGFAVLCPHW